MSHSIEWPRLPEPRRRRRLPFILLLVLLAAILLGGRTALSYYVDALWFGSLGYADVFWKTLRLQSAVFTAFAAATFLILYGSFLALKRAYLAELAERSHDLHRRPADEAAGRLHPAHPGRRRFPADRRCNRRRHDGGVADARALSGTRRGARAALSIRSSASR